MILKSLAVAINLLLLLALYLQWSPFEYAMRWSARQQARMGKNDSESPFRMYHLSDDNSGDVANNITLTIKSGQHFWFPQIAIWAQDTSGQFIKTLFVTDASGKNEFYSGRTKENFKNLDRTTRDSEQSVYVNALPHWKGKQTRSTWDPHIDGVSAATPHSSFTVRQQIPRRGPVDVYLEVNVAFDENRFYSEYDFPDDTLYHSGTGLLGQPSMIYSARINPDVSGPALFRLLGRGHHSGQTDSLYTDLSTITTARHILNWAIVEWNNPI